MNGSAPAGWLASHPFTHFLISSAQSGSRDSDYGARPSVGAEPPPPEDEYYHDDDMMMMDDEPMLPPEEEGPMPMDEAREGGRLSLAGDLSLGMSLHGEEHGKAGSEEEEGAAGAFEPQKKKAKARRPVRMIDIS